MKLSKKYVALLAVLVCVAALGIGTLAQGPKGKALTEADMNKVLDDYAAAWATNKMEPVLDLLTPDAISIDNDVAPFLYQNEDGMKQWWKNGTAGYDLATTKITGLVQDNRRIRLYGNSGVIQAYFHATIEAGGQKIQEHGLETLVVKMTPKGPKIAASHASYLMGEKVEQYGKVFPGKQ
jgi:ketosteroid isomerase-like protein